MIALDNEMSLFSSCSDGGNIFTSSRTYQYIRAQRSALDPCLCHGCRWFQSDIFLDIAVIAFADSY